MNWSRLLAPKSRRRRADKANLGAHPARLSLEQLETRLVPYSVSGNAWPVGQLVTISFIPDGTPVSTGGATTTPSNLFATLNAKFGSPAAWQATILRAAQMWAQQTNLNFQMVGDDGSSLGSGDYQQGDPNKGDIRIGGYAFGNGNLATAFMPPPVNNYSVAGDVLLNTAQPWNNNATYDLFTVACHEIGHALGLGHSSVISSQMYAAYGGVKGALASDDISGIRAVYGTGASRTDAFDLLGSNGLFSTASPLLGLITGSPTTVMADVSTTTDLDYYAVIAPLGASTMNVSVQSSGQSLLAPFFKVCNGLGGLIDWTWAPSTYGATINLSINVTPGSLFFIVVDGADASAFGTGKYALNIGFNVPAPVAPSLVTTLANGEEISGGGGIPTSIDDEALVNVTTGGDQLLAGAGRQVAMDAAGNYVVAWASQGQDGAGWGVFARRFGANGAPQGGEFQVNVATAGDQTSPAVAMDDAGNFVVVWQGVGSGADVFARRYGADGAPLGGEFVVNTTTGGDQTAPAVAMSYDGAFAVAWTGVGNGADVFARGFDASGNATGAEFLVNFTTAGEQVGASVAIGSSGDLVVTWSGMTSVPGNWWNQLDNSGWGVYSRRFSLSGTALTGQFRINTTLAGDQRDASVALAPDGGYVVAWSSANQDGDGWGVYARRYGSNGNPLGGEFLVATTTAGDQSRPSVAMDASGNFLITWTSVGQDGDGGGVFARQYDANGVEMGDEFQVNTTSSGEQNHASAAVNEIGRLVVVWSGNGEGDDSGVFARRYSIQKTGAALEGVSDSFDPAGHDHEIVGQAASLSSVKADRLAACPTSQRPLEWLPFAAGEGATPVAGFDSTGKKHEPIDSRADVAYATGDEPTRPLDEAFVEFVARAPSREADDPDAFVSVIAEKLDL